ncbi:ABC transporter ATP-binding protein [Marinibacterium profundimaris]|uniref:Branched-chain amino acid ABC transporter substrate-binding protein n=1 Tax=Marinibacterium profundimaris TaxID=1679460 RepID=A0A225NZP2_9RHOB|nr:ABC transporter ATP-binding protein [Marinibacterium profundimaris]OWU77546.1 branched-chain amino acid ABC transporter substrate-binding protein [Marinibacterium profundimaris]
MTVLEVTGLNKSFGGIKATDDLTLTLEPGELHAVIGPNGAGKTTLISQLCGLQFPDTGAIRFLGRDITRMTPHRRARMGMARSFQITSLIMDMSVEDNVALAVQARAGTSFRFIRPARRIASLREPARAMLDRVGLLDKADHPTVALSHGEHRRMEIAIALATQARLMLLDEPMAGLGGEDAAEMVALLRSIKGDRTILLIEHDMDAVFALADRISVLVYGHIIATGAPDEIRANAAVQQAYLGED